MEKKIKSSNQKLAIHKETQQSCVYKSLFILEYNSTVLFLSAWECFDNTLLVNEYFSRWIL